MAALSPDLESGLLGATKTYGSILLVGIVVGLLVLLSPIVAVAVAGVSILLLVVLSRPVLLAYMLIVATTVSSGMERGKLIPYSKPNEIILLFAVVVGLLLLKPRRQRQVYAATGIDVAPWVLMVGLSLLPAVIYLVRGIPLGFDDLKTLFAPVQYPLMYWLFRKIITDKKELKGVIRMMVSCATIVALIGILQGAQVPFVEDLVTGWYASPHQAVAAHYGRVTSLFASWNTLGIFLMLDIFLLAALAMSEPKYLSKMTIYVSLLVQTACLVLSGSYAGMIGLVVGLLTISIVLNGIGPRTMLLMVTGLAVVGFTAMLFWPMISQRLGNQFGYGGLVPATLLYRMQVWIDIYLPAIQKDLLWGVSPTIPTSFSWRYTESQYVTLLFSFGVSGLVAFATWFALTVSGLWFRLRFSAELRPMLITAIVSLCVLFLAGFTNAVFTYSGVIEYLWIFLALASMEGWSTEKAKHPIPDSG